MKFWTARPALTFGYSTFALAMSVANVALYNLPLYAYATAGPAGERATWLSLLILSGLQVVLFAFVLTALSLLSIRLTKAVSIVLLIGNSVALYFIRAYHVVLDKTMMGNVLGTDRDEALALFHPQLLLYVLALGVLPALLVARTTIRDSTRAQRLVILACTAVAGCAMIYAGSSSWLWFDKRAKTLGGLMLPWAYVANTARYVQDRIDASRPQAPLPPLRFESAPDGPQKTIVVLVIGESARAANFSLYGYPRNTNPELARSRITVLPAATSCATYTTAAIRCMLSHRGDEAPSRVTEETLPSYLQRHGVQVIWRSNNWGEPPLKVDLYQRLDDIRRSCAGAACRNIDADEGLLYGLRDLLASSKSRRILVVLHMAGSHGPTYWRKYPPTFDRFQPACQSVDLATCSQASLTNAYDNTILYADHVLAETIRAVGAVPRSASTLIYMSDHGESLGEQGLYLHGTPDAIAPAVQRTVPLLIWMSPTFQKLHSVSPVDMSRKGPFSDNQIFHSILGAFDARSAVYEPQSDLFAHAK